MSLNTAHAEGGVVIHQGEMILLHAPNATISFSGSEELKFGEKSGNAYLTTHRLIFLGGKNTGNFKSFSLPFCVLSEVDVEQPMFGANFMKGKVRAQPDGGWRGEAKFKLVFKSGGAIDFAQGMVKAMQIARQMNAQSQYWNNPPPSYSTATAPNSGFMPAPASYYSAPSNYYGWMPPAYNFPPPAAGTVYMSDAPPPYPGISVPQNQGFQQPGFQQQGFQQPGFQQPGFQQQSPENQGFYPPQQNGFHGAQPAAYPQQQMYPQQPYSQPGMYPQQASAAPGYFPPGQNGFAYANGTQAFVPTSAPPPYDFANKKND